MSLVTDIGTIVSTLYPTATYILSSKFQANLKSFSLASTALPLIILDNELSKDVEIKQNNNIQKDSRIVISFLSLDHTGNTDAQSNSIVESMEAYADRVAVQIYQLLPVRLTKGNQKYTITPIFHAFSTNLTGVALEMRANYNTTVNFDY